MGIVGWIANNVAVRGGIDSIRVTDTPAAGEVLTATSATTADWEPAGGGGGAVSSVDGQTGAVDLSGVYAPIADAGVSSVDGQTGDVDLSASYLPPATPFTVVDMPNTVTGVGTMKVMVFPADDGVLAFAIAGDAYPRWLLTSNETDGLYLGNGTVNPYTEGSNLYGSQGIMQMLVHTDDGDVRIGAGQLGPFAIGSLYFLVQGTGPIIQSPDATNHRIIVGNDGTLSTEIVT